jgi:hypothetical protein
MDQNDIDIYVEYLKLLQQANMTLLKFKRTNLYEELMIRTHRDSSVIGDIIGNPTIGTFNMMDGLNYATVLTINEAIRELTTSTHLVDNVQIDLTPQLTCTEITDKCKYTLDQNASGHFDISITLNNTNIFTGEFRPVIYDTVYNESSSLATAVYLYDRTKEHKDEEMDIATLASKYPRIENSRSAVANHMQQLTGDTNKHVLVILDVHNSIVHRVYSNVNEAEYGNLTIDSFVIVYIDKYDSQFIQPIHYGAFIPVK